MSSPRLPIYDRAAVVIPARNERANLPACLRAMLTATLCVPMPVTIVVVLDASDDGSTKLAGQYGPDVHFVSVEPATSGPRARSASVTPARCGGMTPSAGTPPPMPTAEWIRAGWSISWVSAPTWFWAWCASPTGITIPPTSLTAICGPTRRIRYSSNRHEHIHGANMGFSSRAYWRVGGFRALASGEDVDLVGGSRPPVTGSTGTPNYRLPLGAHPFPGPRRIRPPPQSTRRQDSGGGLRLTGGNGARFAAMPLSGGGTPAREWLTAETLPALDLTECPGLIVVAPHPDDETLGLGAMAAQLAASGIDVQVVSVSDGGAADPVRRRHCGFAWNPHEETNYAVQRGFGDSTPMSLGLPDGQLAYHEDGLTDALVEILDDATPGTWCAATWRGDGHPDHETVGRAAAAAAHAAAPRCWSIRCGCGTGPARPIRRCRGTAPTGARAHLGAGRKHNAAQCFRSQFEASARAAPTLPAFVLQRLLAVGELVFR